mmetsp:Transcript_10131/g.16776  ORF Transcript_10131/g.16776 Transcript_10131/m.16776 type:complete len:450 (+) Transcript_10131:91-1440(+)
MSGKDLTSKDIESSRLELHMLTLFAQQHLPNASSPVAQAVQKAIQTVNVSLQESEKQIKAAALSASVASSTSPNISNPLNSSLPKHFQLLASSSDILLPLHSPTEAIALFFHSVLLCFDDIICIAEKGGGGVPGFAAPLAPLPPGSVVPTSWNKSIDSITFLYKHKAAPGKIIRLEVTKSSSEATRVGLGFKATSSKPYEVVLQNSAHLSSNKLAQCAHISSISQVYADPSSLAEYVTHEICQALPFLQEELDKSRQRELDEAHSQPMEVTRDLPPSRLQHAHINRMSPSSTKASFNPNPSIAGPSVGSSDVHPPLPSVVPPSFASMGPQGQLPALYGDEGGDSGTLGSGGGIGGMLVGPDHEIFQGGVRGGVGMFPGGGAPGFGTGMPQPRYDPIINPDIYTDPHIAPGMQGRGGPGRGRGRGGRGAPRVPGEPAPDHLKPPDFGDFI